MKIGRWLFWAILSAVILTGCGRHSQQEENSMIKLAFISKDLDHYWYQQVKSGMESKCQEMGMKLQCFNSDDDDDTCIRQVKQVIREEYDGLMICATDQKLGSEIGKLCAEAEIPVVTIDDSMRDADGKDFPYVGMATREVGSIGGAALAKMAKEKEFPLENGDVRILEIDVPRLSVFRERLTGYEDALLTNSPLNRENITVIDVSTGMYEANCEIVKRYFQENVPDKNTYWIICGVNDDCALAPMHVLKEMGVPAEQIIACGLGGYELSIREFEAQNRNYITVMTQPDVEGAQAAEMLHEYLVNGEALDTSIILGGAVATCDNYMLYFEDSGNK